MIRLRRVPSMSTPGRLRTTLSKSLSKLQDADARPPWLTSGEKDGPEHDEQGSASRPEC